MQSSEKHSDPPPGTALQHGAFNREFGFHSTVTLTCSSHAKAHKSLLHHSLMEEIQPRHTSLPCFLFFPSPIVETDAEVDTTTGSEEELEHSSALPLIPCPRVIEKTLLSHRTIYCLA